MGWILTVVLVAAGAVAWLMLRYPGGWRCAFGPEYAEHRRDLDAARGKLRDLKREAGRERGRARSAVEAAERAHASRVGEARAHLDRLRSPDRGSLRSSLGDSLRLYDPGPVFELASAGRRRGRTSPRCRRSPMLRSGSLLRLAMHAPQR
ncbi:hypothetical protein ACFRQP_41045, partial [Kitasatospora sp. NPDC056789]